jgi:hypothetical protein
LESTFYFELPGALLELLRAFASDFFDAGCAVSARGFGIDVPQLLEVRDGLQCGEWA